MSTYSATVLALTLVLAAAPPAPHALTRPTVVNGTLLPAGTVVTDARPERFSFALSRPARINGWDLPADTTVIHTGGGFVQYVLGAPATLAHVPFSPQSPVTFKDGKLEGRMDLSRAAVAGGYFCSEHHDVYFHAGRVVECRLLRRTTIRGMPCAADDFGDDGTFAECTLAADYRRFGYTWPAGTHVEIAVAGTSHMTTGSRAPNLLFLGRPLPAGSDAGFDGSTLTLDLKTRVAYRGCHIYHVYAPAGGRVDVSTVESTPACIELTVPPGAVTRASSW